MKRQTPRSRHQDQSLPIQVKSSLTGSGSTSKNSATPKTETKPDDKEKVTEKKKSSQTAKKKWLWLSSAAAWKKAWQKKQQHLPSQKRLPRPLRILLFPVLNPIARIVLLFLVIAGVAGLVYILKDLPSPRNLTSSENYPVSTQIFDRHGTLLYEIYADENRTPIEIKTLPPYVYQASIAIEDQNFYHHFGFDIIGIIRAVRNTLQGKRLEGGSTITQQLVKTALLTRERTWTRKAKEAVLALATEVLYSKEQILEMYLNYIPYGGTSVGIESAAQRYFNKHAKDLDVAEAAMLAGLPQLPSRYSPFGSTPEEGKKRQSQVLKRMADDKYITQEQAASAEKEVLHFAISKTDIQAPHFVFYVRDLLYTKYGEKKVETGGLRVYTSLDLNIQNVAQASLSAEVATLTRSRVGNGAALVTKPNTGEILAMIGSKDYFNSEDDGQVNVTISNRQPGSSVKPLMYTSAFQEKTLNPGSYLLDIPTCFEVPGQKAYCPKNYDGSFRGPVTIRKSLGNSLNIPAVKALNTMGVAKFIEYGQRLGISSWKDPSRYGLSLTLGGGEVKMTEMAEAFGTLANQGVRVPLLPILKVTDFRGNVVDEVKVDERVSQLTEMTEDEDISENGDLRRVFNRGPAYLTAHIMQDNNARVDAFGARSQLVVPNQIVSAKTGTTNDLKDNWTVGFTPQNLVITWVGNNDGSPMNQSLVSGITGAAPIWNDIMSFLLKGKEPIIPDKPSDVASATVCVTGFPAQEGQPCATQNQELFWQRSKPSLAQEIMKEVYIHPENGLPYKSGESMDGLVLQPKLLITDPFTTDFCLDCARPVDEQGKPVYENITVNTVSRTEGEETQNSNSQSVEQEQNSSQ